MARLGYNLQSGDALSRNYRVVDFLGKGWEGEVYRVRERRTGIDRAVKIFYPRRNLKGSALLRYARKLNRLKTCPIVIQYHHRELTIINDQWVEFLVSDYAEGEVLSDFIQRQPRKRLTDFEALHCLYHLAAGVEQIHFSGEYHGDIHADNIMIRRRGIGFDIHLVDFFDLGRSNRDRIQQDVYDLAAILHELVGGTAGYRRAGDAVRQIVLGRRQSLIRQYYRHAGDIRIALENLEWVD